MGGAVEYQINQDIPREELGEVEPNCGRVHQGHLQETVLLYRIRAQCMSTAQTDRCPFIMDLLLDSENGSRDGEDSPKRVVRESLFSAEMWCIVWRRRQFKNLFPTPPQCHRRLPYKWIFSGTGHQYYKAGPGGPITQEDLSDSKPQIPSLVGLQRTPLGLWRSVELKSTSQLACGPCFFEIY
jgi:hypothetical protein